MEATAGFEPAHRGFADPCVTTSPRGHHSAMTIATKMYQTLIFCSTHPTDAREFLEADSL